MPYSKILIVGKRCSGKSTLFWRLQKELSWPVFSLSHFLRDFIRTQGLTAEQIDQHSRETSIEVEERIQKLLMTDDHVIIESRMLGFLTQPIPDTCRLLLSCDEAVRAQRSAQREGISIEKAQSRLHKRENKLMNDMISIYNRDDFYHDDYYDAVIDTTNLTREEVLQSALQHINENL